MKKRLPILTIALLISCFSAAYGQGWEREYDTENFNNIRALPNGHFAFNSWNEVYIADGLGNILRTTSTDFPEITEGGISARNLLLMNDGSVTGWSYNNTLSDDTEPDKAFIYNLDPGTGQFRWSTLTPLPATTNSYYSAGRLLSFGDTCYYFLANLNNKPTGTSRPALIKLDSLGNILWYQHYLNPYTSDNNGTAFNFSIHPDGGLVILVNDEFLSYYLLRVAMDGAPISTTRLDFSGVGGAGNISANTIIPQPDGSYLLSGRYFSENRGVVYRAEANGLVSWITELGGGPSSPGIKQQPDGTVLALANRFQNGSAIVMNALTADGDILWWNEYPHPFYQQGADFDFTPDGGFIIAGEIREYGQPVGQADIRGYLLKIGARGQLYNSQVEGYVFEDIDEDCSQLPEMPLKGWLVALEGADTLYALTDSLGRYARRLNPGGYQPRVYPPSNYWGLCPPPQVLIVPDFDTLSLNFPVQTAIACPNLQVDISAPFLRRCFDATYTVYYCNTGTVPAPDAYIEVELDAYLTFNSATLPVSNQQGDTYTFQLGDIDVGECGSFQIQATVDCDDTVLGQTHCTTAHIYPDSICNPPMNWSGASVEVGGACQGDSVRFFIQNVGTAPTSVPLDYLVIEDQVILRQGLFNLAPNAIENITLPATGATLRLEAEQEPFHPGNSMPTITIEGCGNPTDDISLGFTTQYWEDDGDDFISIDCQENIGSYDPNDKRANPKGFGAGQFIEPNTDIEYHIRFQNTGSDTAFTVRIMDQLAEALDITTVRPGASSHPYSFNIRPGRWLEFRFDNILLPDSDTNEPASHGFVKFRVAQLPGLPDSTTIQNRAAIYFDFNEPVITYPYQHIVMRDFLPAILQPDPEGQSTTRIYPNPFDESCTIELENVKEEQPVRMEIFDSLGRLVRRDQYSGPSFTFQRKKLPRGIYFYQVGPADSGRASKGKLIIQ
ncbi:MAG: T9SS type A sorting domain-containing protein [Phaeodactylibacter sp.]|nr:T9SS type A sorting domain-containing protein [Phaeodactylibacter sp.]